MANVETVPYCVRAHVTFILHDTMCPLEELHKLGIRSEVIWRNTPYIYVYAFFNNPTDVVTIQSIPLYIEMMKVETGFFHTKRAGDSATQ